MEAHAAGEQAVAVGVVHHVAGRVPRARRASARPSRPTGRGRRGCSRRGSAGRRCRSSRAPRRPARAAPRAARTDRRPTGRACSSTAAGAGRRARRRHRSRRRRPSAAVPASPSSDSSRVDESAQPLLLQLASLVLRHRLRSRVIHAADVTQTGRRPSTNSSSCPALRHSIIGTTSAYADAALSPLPQYCRGSGLSQNACRA